MERTRISPRSIFAVISHTPLRVHHYRRINRVEKKAERKGEGRKIEGKKG
jgi:hypothetical protein